VISANSSAGFWVANSLTFLSRKFLLGAKATLFLIQVGTNAKASYFCKIVGFTGAIVK